MATAAIVASAVIGVGTSAASYFEQKKAGREAERQQEKANRTESVQAQVENARNRRRAIAQARMAQASNQANMPGAVQSSSALSGVQSGISTQLGANIGAQSQSLGSQQAAFNLRQGAANTLAAGQRRANMWSTVGQVGQTLLQSYAMNRSMSPQSTPDLNTSRAGSQRSGYTGQQFQNWLNR